MYKSDPLSWTQVKQLNVFGKNVPKAAFGKFTYSGWTAPWFKLTSKELQSVTLF